MKIQVPQEQQQKIVELYNQNFNRKQIKQMLNLSFGDSVIKRILEENHCVIRSNPGAKKGGAKKDIISLEDQIKIIDLYNQGYGLNYISKQMNKLFSPDKVKRVLKDNNVTLRNYTEAILVKPESDLRKYSINDDYNFETHNGAWILGFIAADGYLPKTQGAKNRITISLARQDEEVLYRIKNELEYEGPIYQYEATGGYPASSLSFTSKKLREKIESYGIVNNKTFVLDHLPEKLSNEFMIDYIRGFFDGDGSIFEPKDKLVNISFTCASKSFLEDIVKYLHSEYQVSLPAIYETERVHKVYDIKYYVKDSLVLCDKFYNHEYLALARKQKHYFEILKKKRLRE